MIAHTGLAVRDFDAAKRFYERALEPLGYTAKMEHGESPGFNDGKNTDFWIGRSKTESWKTQRTSTIC
jgi:catechol 2,3-dioxygenase-like lactoylglutathione lyase family enzyme